MTIALGIIIALLVGIVAGFIGGWYLWKKSKINP